MRLFVVPYVSHYNVRAYMHTHSMAWEKNIQIFTFFLLLQRGFFVFVFDCKCAMYLQFIMTLTNSPNSRKKKQTDKLKSKDFSLRQ